MKIKIYLLLLASICFYQASSQVPSGFMIGTYLIDDNAATYGPVNNSSNFEFSTVTITAGTSPNLREFTVNVFPGISTTPITVVLDLSNNMIEMQYVQLDVGCTATSRIAYGPALNNSTYNVSDDSFFAVSYEEDVDQSCNTPIQSSFFLIKTTQRTFVPDDAFENRLLFLGYDDVFDNYVDTAQIENLTSLNLSFNNISDLTGIEDFTALQILDVGFNNLTQIDLSQNIALSVVDLSNNSLLELDLSNNINLLELNAQSNFLRVLDVRNGNNQAFVPNGRSFNILANNLTCINVDNVTYMTNNFSNFIDSFTTFSTDCTTASIDDDLSINLQLSQNPVDNDFIIYNNTNKKIDYYKFFDTAGNLIKSGKYVESDIFDTSEFSSGLYFLNLQLDNGQRVIKKIIKK